MEFMPVGQLGLESGQGGFWGEAISLHETMQAEGPWRIYHDKPI
jgi:hypothetical protein